MYCVIYDPALSEQFETEIKPLLENKECNFYPYNSEFDASKIKSEKVITWLGDESFYKILLWAEEHEWQLGFIAHPEMNRFYRNFLIPNDIQESIDDIFNCEPVVVDLMVCNDKPVLSSVLLGDDKIMMPAAKADENIFSKFYNLLVVAFNTRHATMNQYTLTTAKDVCVKTVALGIGMVYRPGASDFTRRVIGVTEKDEASLHAVILAPRSMTEVINYFITRVMPERQVNRDIPKYAGSIKSSNIVVEGGLSDLTYIHDGDLLEAKTIDVSVRADALTLLTSSMPEKNTDIEEKESVRTSYLPKGQAINALCGRLLPWINHSDQEEIKDTYVSLQENSKLSETYIVLTILSVLLASLGMFSNSTPVIIGAMILAPLMAPIISLAMGLLRQKKEMILDSALTVFAGVAIAIVVGVIVTLFTPLNNLNDEISARLSPTLLDLGVAIFSGIAGAYASARSEVAKSLAGVAIAVALVPPLVVSAIGIGWWQWDVFWGSFLMFLTNLTGMVLAAAMTFLVMGFSPFRIAKKGLLIITPIVLAVSIPLALSFNTMVKEQGIIHELNGWQYEDVVIRDVRIRNQKPLLISVKLQVKEHLSGEQIDELKAAIEKHLGMQIKLEVMQATVR